MFLKSASAFIWPGGTIVLPKNSKRADYETDLGVMIGRGAKSVQESEALEYVFGYTIVLDMSIRDEEFASIVLRKLYDTSAPIALCITKRDEIVDP